MTICDWCNTRRNHEMKIVQGGHTCRKCLSFRYDSVSAAGVAGYNWSVGLGLNEMQQHLLSTNEGQRSVSEFFLKNNFGDYELAIRFKCHNAIEVLISKECCERLSDTRPMTLAKAVDEVVALCNTYFKSKYFKEFT